MKIAERSNFVVGVLALLLALPAAGKDSVSDSSALFRSRSETFSSGTMRSVSVSAPKGWRRVAAINQDPLSLAQWTPSSLKCSTGAASRISLYAVDVGPQGPQKLLQRWLPEATAFHVAEPERGFVVIRADAEARKTQAVVAYPLSDQHITPLAGSIGGVKIVVVAESTTMTSQELETDVRSLIRSQKAVKTLNSQLMDVPFVLFHTTWHKTVSERLDEDAQKGKPKALISKAYSVFGDADGFVPIGQNWLLKAAQAGHPQAQLDLVRLSRRNLLTIEVSPETLAQWTTALAKQGSDDARFWLTETRPFDEIDKNIPGLENLRDLSACGQPEARRTWAKHLVQSFKASDRFNGRNIVMGLMKNPPLEGTLPLTTRVPRAVDAPAVEELKAAALLKTACPSADEPEQELFVSKDDFKVEKTAAKKSNSAAAATVEEFPELKEAERLDKMVNSGSMKTLRAGLKLACNWSGAEQDRDNLVIEIAARQNDGFGKWRRFRACESIKENNMASVCREKALKQSRKNVEARYRDILVTASPELRNAVAQLRSKSTAFHETLLERSYSVAATVHEKSELDAVRLQMEQEFLNLVAATLKRNLKDQIRDVVTGRRLLLLPATEEDSTFTLKRQPATASFMKKELERLTLRMTETMSSIQEADREDIGKDFKSGFASAHEAWRVYRASYVGLVAQMAKLGQVDSSLQAAADVWFHIEGIYYFEKMRDREINRTDTETDTGTGAEITSKGFDSETSRPGDLQTPADQAEYSVIHRGHAVIHWI